MSSIRGESARKRGAVRAIARALRVRRPVTVLQPLLDILAVFVGFWTVYLLYRSDVVDGLARRLPPAESFLYLTVWYALLLTLVLADLGLYRPHSSLLNIGELKKIFRGSLLAFAVFVATLFFKGNPPYSRTLAVGSVLCATLFVLLERRSFASLRRWWRLRNRSGRRILIYGAGSTGRRLMKKIAQAPHLGATVVGFIDDFAPLGKKIRCRISQMDDRQAECRILGRMEDLARLVDDYGVEELLVAVPHLGPQSLADVVQAARESRLSIGVVPRIAQVAAEQLKVEELAGISVLRPHGSARRQLYLAIKRVADLGIACALIPLLFPLWGLSWLAIRLESPGPAVFRQRRVGLAGREFEMYKFRTMYADSPAYARSPTLNNDRRVTKVGRILRLGGFDETLQLINVLAGQMSLVGPRPEMPFIVGEYDEVQRQRLQAKPGITGLWQLSSDRNAEIHENLEYDLYYVQYRSLSLDLAILIETFFFSTGVLLKGLLRRGRTGNDPHPQEGDHERGTDEFVLAVLDQRIGDGLPTSWSRAVPALCNIARSVPVRFVVAECNVGLLDDLLQQTVGEEWTENGLMAEYVPYRGRPDLLPMVRRARLVLTDLPTAASWAGDGVEVVLMREGGDIEWFNRSGNGYGAFVREIVSRPASVG